MKEHRGARAGGGAPVTPFRDIAPPRAVPGDPQYLTDWRDHCLWGWDALWDAREEDFQIAQDLLWDIQGASQRWGKRGLQVVWRGTSMEKERDKGIKGASHM